MQEVSVGDIVKWKHSFREGEWIGGIVIKIDEFKSSYTIQPFYGSNINVILLAETYGDYWIRINKDILR
jgi:hypothetical protein